MIWRNITGGNLPNLDALGYTQALGTFLTTAHHDTRNGGWEQ
jgi:hypothetical protein